LCKASRIFRWADAGRRMARDKQRKILEMKRGLFLVRYAAAADENEPPKITLAPDHESRDALQLIAPPGETETALWRPGACLVLRAISPGSLIVEVEPLSGSRSASSTVRVEPLSVGRLTAEENTTPLKAPLDLAGFALIGHVAGRGDVRVKADEWLAGPAAPARIEGIGIDWRSKPAGVRIRYSVSTAKPQTISQRLLNDGEFAGTRGKALPLTAVAFEVNGDAAPELQLAVEAIFLGSPTSRAVGRRISLTGPTGREPLVGLKVTAENAGVARNVRPAGGSDGAGRVRVFRGRPKSSSAEPSPREKSARAG